MTLRSCSRPRVLAAVFAIVATITVVATPRVGRAADLLAHPVEILGLQGDLADELYPLGFSPKGAFAYLHVQADEAVGCFLWDLVVIDLVTDRQLTHLSWSTHLSGPDGSCSLASTAAEVFQHYGAEIRPLLAGHGIDTQRPLSLARFPLRVGHREFSAHLRPAPPSRRPRTASDGSLTERTLQVRLAANTGGVKVIGSLKAREDDGIPYTYGHAVAGLVRSPFEKRVVVIVSYGRRGWEGPPNVSTFALFGASLTKGFK